MSVDPTGQPGPIQNPSHAYSAREPDGGGSPGLIPCRDGSGRGETFDHEDEKYPGFLDTGFRPRSALIGKRARKRIPIGARQAVIARAEDALDGTAVAKDGTAGRLRRVIIVDLFASEAARCGGLPHG